MNSNILLEDALVTSKRDVMLMRLLLFVLLFLSITYRSVGQVDFKELEKELSLYGDFLNTADDYSHRVYANNKFRHLLEDVLRKEDSFEYPFDSLRWISKIVSQDSSFRIFTWQLSKSNKSRDYYGYLQLNSGRLYELKDSKSSINDLEYSVFSDSDWFGQVYYNIIDFNNDGKTEYILFGYKLLGDFEKVKTAMPLDIENGEVVFGKEIFEDTISGYKPLIALITSVNSASSLNYDKNKKMIIYDHTIGLMLPDMDGKLHPTKVPDGSYHGYKWNGKYWKFIDKVFKNTLDKAPVDKRRKKTDKGLFGNKKQ